MEKNNERTAKKGIISVILALLVSALVLCAAVCVAGYGTNGFKDWSFNNFSHKIEQVKPELSNSSGGAIIKDGESYGISLMSARIAPEDYATYGISTQAESAQTITATIKPAATTNKAVTWAVTGGNDKVTVTPVTGNPLQATFVVSGAFSTQATITCTSQANSSLKATITVDYVKQVFAPTDTELYVGSVKTGGLKPTWVYGTGTVAPTSAKGTIKFNCYPELYEYLKPRHPKLKEYYEVNNIDIFANQTSYGFTPLLADMTESEKASTYEDIAIFCTDERDNSFGYLEYKNPTYYYQNNPAFTGMNIDFVLLADNFNDITVSPQSVSVSKTSFVFCVNGLVK